MTALYPQMVDNSNTTIGGLRTTAKICKSLRATEYVLPYREIGKRLRAIREGFSDLSQKAWAEKHGFNQTQYNNWEKGTRRIPVDAAEKLCLSYGLTLDAIYRGRLDGLPENLIKIL